MFFLSLPGSHLPFVVRPNDGLAKFLSLQRDDDRPHDVDPHRIEHHDRQRGIVVVGGKHDAHDKAFHEGRDEPQKQVFHQGIAGRDSPVHRPHDLSKLLSKVPVQAEPVEVDKGGLGELDKGGLGHTQVN
jgi:hypothetical protein